MNLDQLIRDLNPAPLGTVPGPESQEARRILSAITSEDPSSHARSPRRQAAPWTRPLLVVAVAASLVAVLLVPIIHRLASPTKLVPAASGPGIAKQVAVLRAPDPRAGGGFGWAVAVSGNTAVVGAPGQDSYVFRRTATGWARVAELRQPSSAAEGCFGIAVAVSGSTAVVNDACYNGDTGRLYVYTREATGWRLTAQLEGSDTAGNDKFGFPVAISRDTIVAGAFQHEGSTGRAYVFQKTASHWKQTAELKGSDTVAGDAFGWSVAISGGTIVVGASGIASGASGNAGRAYVFAKTARGWKQTAELKGSDTAATDAFASSVAISGGTVVVGAQDAGRTGRAYVFTKTPHGWTQVSELKGSSAAGLFGYSVGVSGDTVVVGAPVVGELVSFPSRSPGQAYVYTKTAGGWTQAGEVKGSGAVRGDQFGLSVAISGDTALVGEPNHAGRAYVFRV